MSYTVTVDGEVISLEPAIFDAVDCFWAMLARSEEPKTVLDDADIANEPGVYFFMSWDNKPIRIGKAVKLRNRIMSYANGTEYHNKILDRFAELDLAYVGVFYCEKKDCQSEEEAYISLYKPELNVIGT